MFILIWPDEEWMYRDDYTEHDKWKGQDYIVAYIGDLRPQQINANLHKILDYAHLVRDKEGGEDLS